MVHWKLIQFCVKEDGDLAETKIFFHWNRNKWLLETESQTVFECLVENIHWEEVHEKAGFVQRRESIRKDTTHK